MPKESRATTEDCDSLLIQESLRWDNQRLEAITDREIFYGLRSRGELVMVRRCSDARVIIPETNCIDIASIATGGPQKPYGEMVKHRDVQLIVNLTHFDGGIFKPGTCPSGCGGLIAKEKQVLNNTRPEEKGLERYIGEIKSSDPVIQSIFNAAGISRYTEKDVLAAIQDHRTGKIYPLALFSNPTQTMRMNLPLGYLMEGQYNPRKIYEGGIPALNDNYLPDSVKKFLMSNRQQVHTLQEKYPNLSTKLEVQNPRVLVITTAKMSARGRYPDTLREPGSYFQIHIPAEKENGKRRKISQQSINTIIEQAEYPITHFSNTQIILIETGDIEQSKRIATAFATADWAKEWISKSRHQIFLAEVSQEETRRIKNFTLE